MMKIKITYKIIIYLVLMIFILKEGMLYVDLSKINSLEELWNISSFRYVQSPLHQIRLFIFYMFLFSFESIDLSKEVSDTYGLDSYLIHRYLNKNNYIKDVVLKNINQTIRHFLVMLVSALLSSIIIKIMSDKFLFDFRFAYLLVIFCMKYALIYGAISILMKNLMMWININTVIVFTTLLYAFLIMIDCITSIHLLLFNSQATSIFYGIIFYCICLGIYSINIYLRKEII